MKALAYEETMEPLDPSVAGSMDEEEDLGSERQEPSVSLDYSLRQYMKEVNAVPLLPHEQTMDLFRAFEEKQKALEVLESRKKATDKRRRAKAALEMEISALKEHLITSNLRLVVYLANRYQGRGVSIQDLVQEGNIGLIRAIDKFDYTMGYRFSTYGTWWIRQAMLRAIHQTGRLIRIPTHMLEKFQRFVRDNEGPQPVSNDGGAPLLAGEASGDHSDMFLLMEVMRDPLSLDAPMTDDGLDLQEVTRDENQTAPEDRVIDQDLKVKLRAAMSNLTLREEVILRLRYGIDLPASHTLEEVGQLFHLTKERIRQIESRALRRLYLVHAS
jgi:RNA polymerase primary sigma factor